jgi:endonuclease/exonuclease/phosphatase family metal-dependent hydrolase
LDHDFVLWLGDLNYRIDDLSFAEIVTAAETQQFQRLRERDQLNNEKRANKVFHGFTEFPINFQPTYKYTKGTDRYHNPPGATKPREPAWCDRILWRGEGNQRCYNACNYIQISDHKPIFSFFELPTKIEDYVNKTKVRSQIL